MKLSRRAFIRIISFSLAIIFTLTGALLLARYRQARLQRALYAGYRRSYFELISSLESIEASLVKASVSTSPERLALLSCDIWNSAEAAGALLGALPYELSENSQTAAFLNRVGSFSYCLAADAGKGTLPDADRAETLRALRRSTQEVLRSLSSLSAYIYEKDFFDGSDLSLPEADEAYDLASGMTMLEAAFPETPTLLYDGPYSEHLTSLTPKINSKKAVTADEALDYVASLYQVSPASVQLEGEVGGDLPCYLFSLRNGRSLSLLVTQRGGMLLGLTSSGSVNSGNMSSERAEAAARAFLARAGYRQVVPSYHHVAGGVMYINFEATQKDIILYPDLIQVGVSLADGEVISFDARGYLSNHTARTLPSPAFSREDTEQALSDALTLDDVRLALIPTDGKNELLCYEIACHSTDGDNFLIYLNCLDGREEKVMLLREDEDGILAF